MEIWKDISGYENKYQVSNFGRIKSLQRDVISGRGGFRTVKEKILKPKIDRYGYLTIDLRDQNQIRKTLKIHRLVAIAFISNPENKIQVNHKNESKTDNTIQNLEWTTPLQNSNYGTRTERSAKKRRNSSISKNVEQKDLNGNYKWNFIND